MENLKLKYLLNIYHLTPLFPTAEDMLYECVKSKISIKKPIDELITYKTLKTYISFSKIGDDKIKELLLELKNNNFVDVVGDDIQILKTPW